jgi:hypothetical protein
MKRLRLVKLKINKVATINADKITKDNAGGIKMMVKTGEKKDMKETRRVMTTDHLSSHHQNKSERSSKRPPASSVRSTERESRE